MITKQQALEFIYELSQKYEVTINGKTGFIGINSHFDIDEETFYYEYEECAYENSLEAAITAFIRHYINYDILKDFDKIPVDVDMLEVGQTYKLGTGETLYLKDITEYKLIFTHTKNNIIFGIDKEDIREIYKVSE